MSCDDAGCKVNGVHRGDNVDFTYNFVNKIDVSSFHKINIHCAYCCIYSSVSQVFSSQFFLIYCSPCTLNIVLVVATRWLVFVSRTLVCSDFSSELQIVK